MDVAKRILDLCRYFDITPNRVATLGDIPGSTLQDIISKKNKSPQIDTIEKICAGFGITLIEFFNEGTTNEDDLPLEAKREIREFVEYIRYKYRKK